MPFAAPLRGVRVLDLTRLLPGNYCTWLLGSLGADVIKVEDPGAGDYMRSLGAQVDGMSATHHVVNRGKRSLVLDLKQPAGVAALLELARTADVLVESFRPGVLDRLGVGWEQLHAVNPALVLASVCGYGTDGPLAATAGHDINYMAFSGLLDRMRPGGQAPALPAVALADVVGGGLVTALGTLALIMRARQTGEGGRIESAVAEAMALLPSLMLCDELAGQPIAPPGQDTYDGGRAWYRTYRLGDGGYVAVGALEQRFFARLCALIGRQDLVAAQHDPARQDDIAAALTAEFGSLTRAQAEAKYAGGEACVNLVYTAADMIASAHARTRGLFASVPGLPFPVPTAPFAVDGARLPESGPAPRQGEHSEQILREAGFGEDRIAGLFAANVARQPAAEPECT
jgi:alpha-methylacyl-CoA racemase